jgi:hypothetical protein
MMKMKFIYIIGLLLLIFGIIMIIMMTRTNDNFENRTRIIRRNKNKYKNKYLTKEETANIIKTDSDNYIKSLSKYDLYARNVSNANEYKNNIINGCLDFTENQILKLNNCSTIAREFFDNKYNWQFALIDDVYEQGFPHTRMDIIFLSPKIVNYTDDNLIKILIHESIHIYQRYNKSEINKYLSDNGYIISRKRDSEPLIRANPDLDEYIYKDKNGEEMINKYKSSTPTGINDIIPSKNEHPFETMAYEISEEYGKFKISKYKNI